MQENPIEPPPPPEEPKEIELVDELVPSTDFGFSTLKQFISQTNGSTNRTTVISPFSLSCGLALCAMGGKGATSRSIWETLQVKGLDYTAYGTIIDNLKYTARRNGDLYFAHFFTTSKNFGIYKEFKDSCKKYFDSSSDNFSHVDDIQEDLNKYVGDKTHDKVIDPVTEPLGRMTNMVITNAVYFRGYWDHGFDKTQTKSATFTKLNGEEKTCEMMYQTSQEFEYFETETYKAIQIPYKSKLNAIVILPHEKSGSIVRQVIDIWSSEWKNCLTKFRKQPGEFYLPKFKVDHKTELCKILGSIGMAFALSPLADYSNLTITPEGLSLTKFYHQTVLEISEESGPPTSNQSNGKEEGSKHNGFTMNVNHSFVLLIRDTETNVCLFMGLIDDFIENFEVSYPTIIESKPKSERAKSPSKSSSSSSSRRSSRRSRSRERRSRSRSRSGSRSRHSSSRRSKRSRSRSRSRDRKYRDRSRSRERSSRYKRSRSRDRYSRRRSRSRDRGSRRYRSRSKTPPYAVRLAGIEERRRTSTIYVGNLPDEFSERKLLDMFGVCGKIDRVTLRVNKQNVTYAFVTYSERTDAEAAMERFKGHTVDGRTVTMDWDVGLDNKRKYMGKSR